MGGRAYVCDICGEMLVHPAAAYQAPFGKAHSSREASGRNIRSSMLVAPHMISAHPDIVPSGEEPSLKASVVVRLCTICSL